MLFISTLQASFPKQSCHLVTDTFMLSLINDSNNTKSLQAGLRSGKGLIYMPYHKKKEKSWMECAKPGWKQFHFASVGGMAVAITCPGWRATPNNCGFVWRYINRNHIINGDNNKQSNFRYLNMVSYGATWCLRMEEGAHWRD